MYSVPPLPASVIEPIVRLALSEDCARAGDLTSDAVCSGTGVVKAGIVAREAGVAAGYDAAALVLRLVSEELIWEPLVGEGCLFAPGTELVRMRGAASALLRAERVCLNFLSILSGVASLTRKYVQEVEGTGVVIAGTRKTYPGLRGLQFRAVCIGGGVRHRHGLDDAVLVKDNHIAVAGGVAEALQRAQSEAGHMRKVGVEVESLEQLEQALPLRPDVILLDNMLPEALRAAVKLAGSQCVLEASGGVNLETVRGIAETGVDVISVGALTHSALALDIGLDWTG